MAQTYKEDLSLLTRSYDMIKAAEQKGFTSAHQITPVMFEPWMSAPEAFCNTACAIVSMWLRTNELTPVVAPWRGGFSYYIVSGKINAAEPPFSQFGAHASWEDAWLTAIHEALKLLPDEPSV